MANTVNSYKWLLTFLIYDNAWYDKEHENEPGYIPLSRQKENLYASIDALDIHEQVKILMVEAKIDLSKKILEVWLRSKSKNEPMLKNPVENPLGTTVMSNNSSLEEILTPLIAENSADHHIIITVGHGSIFGINLYSEKDDTKLPSNGFINLAKQRNNIEFTPEILQSFENDKQLSALLPASLKAEVSIKKELDKLYSRLNQPEKSFEIWVPELNLTVLTIKEINKAFLSVFKESLPVDILVMDNCLMQNLFTQFEFCGTVKFLVAAQSGISYPGFNYVAIIKKICSDINIDPAVIANAFVDPVTIRQHEKYHFFKKDIETRWCLNCVTLDPGIYNNIRSGFIDFFSLLLELVNNPSKKISNEIFQVIKTTNGQLFGYNSYSLPTIKIIDLHVFLKYFKEKVAVNTVLNPFKDAILSKTVNLTEALEKIKVQSFVGDNFFPSEHYYKDEDNIAGLGFGFMLPIKPTKTRLIDLIYEKKGNTNYTPVFLQHSDYFNLIERIWEMNP